MAMNISVGSKTALKKQLRTLKLELQQKKLVLREIEKSYNALFSHGYTTNILLGPDLKVREVNRIFLRRMGYRRREVVGRKCWDFVAEGSRQPARQALNKSLKGKKLEPFEVELLAKNGRRTFLFLPGVITISRAGKFLGYLVSGADITDRLQAEDALRDHEEYYRTLLYSLHEALIAVCDRSGKVTNAWAAPELLERYGLTVRSVVGVRLQTMAHGEPRKMAEQIRQVFSAGQSSRQEYLFGARRGAFWTEVSLSPMKDSSGKPVAAVAFVRDITVRKSAQEALQESAEYQRLIFEHTSDGISIKVVDPATRKWRLVMCNDRYVEMSGRTREQLMAEYGSKIILKHETIPGQREEQHRKITSGQPMRGIDSWIRPDGKENYHEWVAEPVKVGDKMFIVGIDRDTTERRRNEDALQAAHRKLMTAREEERRHLAGELHDSIGQGLVGLQLAIQAAIGNTRDCLPKEDMGRLVNASEKCGDLIREVRQICHGLYPPTLESLGLVAALKQIAGYCRDAKVQASVRCPDELAKRRFPDDVEIALFRIVQEALNNALRHGRAKSVEVEMKYNDGKAVLRILDDGVGFDTAAGSNGLGLSTMQDRATAVNGEMSVTSKPGKTCIEVTVPTALRAGLAEGRRGLPISRR